MLDPGAFEKAFQRFMKAFAEGARIEQPKGVIALDGKALRRGYERGKSHMPPVMVTAWAAQTRMALANVLAPNNNNEAAGALELIELSAAQRLRGDGRCAALPARHRPKRSWSRRGDYVLAVKENQPARLADAKAAIGAATRKGTRATTTTDADHLRKERRTALVAPVKDMAQKHDFPGIRPLPGSPASAAKTRPSSASS